MTGRVSKIDKGMVYVDINDAVGQRCWFEPINVYNIGIGDILTGSLLSLGGQMIFNKSKNSPMNVFIHGHA